MMTPEKAAQIWNSQYPIGTEVRVTDDFKDVSITKTRSVAWVLGGHTAVILIEGRTGGYLLDRVEAV